MFDFSQLFSGLFGFEELVSLLIQIVTQILTALVGA